MIKFCECVRETVSMLDLLTRAQFQRATSASLSHSGSGLASLRIPFFPLTHGGLQAANYEQNPGLEQVLMFGTDSGNPVIIEN